MANISNAIDVARKWPIADLAPKVMVDGIDCTVEAIQGPTSGGTRSLSNAATANPVFVIAYTTATGALVTPAVKRVGTEFSFALKNPTSGVAVITDIDATNHSAETWIVFYKKDEADGTIGGQSSVTH